MDLCAVRLALCLALSGALSATAHAQKPDQVERGRSLYEHYCLICHGHEMVASAGSSSYDLRRFPKDAKARFLRSITEGKPPGMPGWKGEFSEQDLDGLWAFVLSGGDPARPAVGGR